MTPTTPMNLTRRAILGAGAAALAVRPAPTRAAPSPSPAWPSRPITGVRAKTVDPSQFISRRQIHDWQESLNDVGLRATGSPSHHRYIDTVAERLQRAGLRQIISEPVPFRRWAPSRWGLEVVSGGRVGPVPVSWYVPYSGSTGPRGVVAPLSLEPRAGAIGLVTVEAASLQFALFDAVDYDVPTTSHAPDYDPTKAYQRPWLANGAIAAAIEEHQAAGAVGVIVVLPVPSDVAQGNYSPYDGKIRGIPALFCDAERGRQLEQVAGAGGSVRLTLRAEVRDVRSPNVYGIIPGASEELVMVQSHTDGTNGIEENGPEALIAMTQYLSRIPRSELPRSVLVAATTGHMAGMALGTEAFLHRHEHDLVARTAAAISLEHLGAMEWAPNADGVYHRTGKKEINIVFSSPHTEMVKVGRELQNAMGIENNWVLRPFVTDTEGESPNGRWWPGDGEGLWRISGLPSLQSIAGPAYLLASDFDCMPLIDTAYFRQQAIAFTNATLRLARTPTAVLRAPRLEDPLFTPPLALVNLLLLGDGG